MVIHSNTLPPSSSPSLLVSLLPLQSERNMNANIGKTRFNILRDYCNIVINDMLFESMIIYTIDYYFYLPPFMAHQDLQL